MEAIVLSRIRIAAAALLAILAASSLAVRVMAADQSGELAATQRQLAQAQANAAAVTAALDQANAAVATARQRLQDAQGRLEAARAMGTAAEAALTQVTARTQATQTLVDSEVRAAYMSGGTSSLSMLVNAASLPELVDRTVTLDQ